MINLEIHKRKHMAELTHACGECDKLFSDTSSVAKHKVKVYSDETRYDCSQCSKRFKDSEHLRKHERIHAGNDLHVCLQCNKCFLTLDFLRVHEKRHVNGGDMNHSLHVNGQGTGLDTSRHLDIKGDQKIGKIKNSKKRKVDEEGLGQAKKRKVKELGDDLGDDSIVDSYSHRKEMCGDNPNNNETSCVESCNDGEIRVIKKETPSELDSSNAVTGEDKHSTMTVDQYVNSVLNNHSTTTQIKTETIVMVPASHVVKDLYPSTAELSVTSGVMCANTSSSSSLFNSNKKRKKTMLPVSHHSESSDESYNASGGSFWSNDLELVTINRIGKTQTKSCSTSQTESSTGPKFWCSGCSEGFDTEEEVRECFYQHFISAATITSDLTSSSCEPTKTLTDDSTSPGQSFNCRQCGKHFRTAEFLRLHKRKHIGEHRSLTCPQCSKTFTKHSNLRTHIKLHLGERPYGCNECLKTFTTRSNLRAHQVVHNGERPFACTQCEKTFGHSSSLTKHLRTHEPVWSKKLFACPYCSKTFTQPHNLRVHQHLHTGERPFKCERCDRGFATLHSLQRHALRHDGKRPFLCAQCDHGFKTDSDLSTHARVHDLRDAYQLQLDAGEQGGCVLFTPQLPITIDELEGSTQIITPQVLKEIGEHGESTQITPLLLKDIGEQGESTQTTPLLLNDIGEQGESTQTTPLLLNDIGEQGESTQTTPFLLKDIGEQGGLTHNTPQLVYVSCDLFMSVQSDPVVQTDNIEQDRFTQTTSVQVLTTTGEQYQCPQCGKQFTNRRFLRRHVFNHIDERPYVCAQCNKAFKCWSDLNRHERIHNTDMWYMCKHCDKRFPQLSHVQLHERTHTGERPFACTLCEKRFTNSSDLKKHNRIHTGESPYSCSICYRQFNFTSNLRLHERKEHGLHLVKL